MNNSNLKEWLVEIRVKDWVHVPDGHSRAIAYEEVIASTEIGARHIGYDQYSKRIKYEPIARRKFEALGIDARRDICAPDAVQI